jgi:hypothetical protein
VFLQQPRALFKSDLGYYFCFRCTNGDKEELNMFLYKVGGSWMGDDDHFRGLLSGKISWHADLLNVLLCGKIGKIPVGYCRKKCCLVMAIYCCQCICMLDKLFVFVKRIQSAVNLFMLWGCQTFWRIVEYTGKREESAKWWLSFQGVLWRNEFSNQWSCIFFQWVLGVCRSSWSICGIGWVWSRLLYKSYYPLGHKCLK